MTIGHIQRVFSKAIERKDKFIAVAITDKKTPKPIFEVIPYEDFEVEFDDFMTVCEQTNDNRVTYNYAEITGIVSGNNVAVLIKKLQEGCKDAED